MKCKKFSPYINEGSRHSRTRLAFDEFVFELGRRTNDKENIIRDRDYSLL